MYIVYKVSSDVLYNNSMTAETKKTFNYKDQKTSSRANSAKAPIDSRTALPT